MRNTLHQTTLGYKDRGSILKHVREPRWKWAFQRVSKQAAFLCISSPYLRSVYHPRYETMEIPRSWTEKAVQASWFCQPVTRPFLVNEQRTAKPPRPTNDVAWTTYVVHGQNTYNKTSLLTTTSKWLTLNLSILSLFFFKVMKQDGNINIGSTAR